ncbi:MAG: helix-turn-helix domain-containing protein [Clostridiales bacterium]|nr:helix-turn-helix domain-containing protein [Clostridiales bacterium]
MDIDSFGSYLAFMRQRKGLSQRATAQKLGISPMYLSDVENGKRSAFALEKLRRFASVAELSAEETCRLFDLAGKNRGEVSPDVNEYLCSNTYVYSALRTAKSLNADRDDWAKMLEELRQRKGK